MKKLLTVMLMAFAFNSFAGGFTKTDKGTVSWSLKPRTKVGVVSITRNEQNLELRDLGLSQTIRVTLVYSAITPLGNLGKIDTKFSNTDERSQEDVATIIKDKMIAEIVKIEMPSDIKLNNIELKNVECKETGFFSRQLDCKAAYESSLVIEMLN